MKLRLWHLRQAFRIRREATTVTFTVPSGGTSSGIPLYTVGAPTATTGCVVNYRWKEAS